MTSASSPRIPHRFLGDSGLLVSLVSLGSWMFADPRYTSSGWYDLMKAAFEHGINFFDTAELYIQGDSEVFVGDAIKKGISDGVWCREDLVISTKMFWGDSDIMTSGPNAQGLSRKHLIEGTKKSLRRLQLDYVDVIFCHRPEPFTPIEETVRAMNFIIDQGWAFYWGTSEWLPSEILEACEVADRHGLIRPVVEQPQYNIFERSRVDFEYADLYKKYKLGLTTWSPLMAGLLTGKYGKDAEADGGRLTVDMVRDLMVPGFEDKVAKTDKLKAIAAQVGCSLPQFAIAWCLTNENVSTVLLGTRNPAQLADNLQALAFVDKITPEIKAEVDAIVDFKHTLSSHDGFATLRARHLA